MKLKLNTSHFLIALLAMLILGAYNQAAKAGQYDVIYLVRTGTNGVNLFAPGSSGAYQVISATSVNGVVQTSGSGLVTSATPIISSTAALAAAGQSPVPGQIATNGSGGLMIYGTNSAWRAVP